MTAANDEIRAWYREHVGPVSARGKLPARVTERYYEAFPSRRPPGSVALLPGPDEDLDAYDDLGLLEPESDPEPPQEPRRYQAVPEEPETLSADPGPAHGSKAWQKFAKEHPLGSGPKGRAAPKRVTATVRTDISSKISLVLEIPGRVWQARDPVCGSVFIEQRPAIADALTEIVCGSPDLVAWFTGQGGQFMLWFNLVMAVWPVGTMVMAHHVYHTIEDQPAGYQQPSYEDYAA